MIPVQVSAPIKVGDRVTRELYNLTGPDPYVRHGVVTEVYLARFSYSLRRDVTQYAVRWDDSGLEERGYFGEGLKKVG